VPGTPTRAERRSSLLRALDEFLAVYEAEHGEITEAEMRDAARAARGRAVAVRSTGGTPESSTLQAEQGSRGTAGG
jgi:hypothetical protein